MEYFLQGLTMGLAYVAPIQATSFILGVASASCIWFTGLAMTISLLSDHFNAKVLRAINIVCGIVIIFFGCKLLLNLI